MNYYFENYVDAGALYAFLDRLGLVAMETDGSAGYAVLNAFGLVVNSSDKAYEVGFGVFNMLGALVQFFGVIFLSGFWQTVMVRNAFLLFASHLLPFYSFVLFSGKSGCGNDVCIEFPEESGIRADCTFVVGDDCRCSRLFRI